MIELEARDLLGELLHHVRVELGERMVRGLAPVSRIDPVYEEQIELDRRDAAIGGDFSRDEAAAGQREQSREPSETSEHARRAATCVPESALAVSGACARSSLAKRRQ